MRNLTFKIRLPDHTPVAGATVTATLTNSQGVPLSFDTTPTDAYTSKVQGVTDSGGNISLSLWPNEEGVRASKYQLVATKGGTQLLKALVYIPAGTGPLALTDVLLETPHPPLSQVEVILLRINEAQGKVAQDRADTHADRIAVAIDRAIVEELAEELGGGSGETGLVFPALSPLAGHMAVKVVNGNAVYASSANASDFGLVLGISKNSAQGGEPVSIKASGKMVESSWSWIPNKPVYLGVNGALTQVEPIVGYIQMMGLAIASDTLVIDIELPFEL